MGAARPDGGWWRHAHGGYGWVGPLFWPFAYYDLYDYAMWGYDPSFWDYGYGDIYAGIFAPYGYDDLAGYLPSSGSARIRVHGSAPRPRQVGELQPESNWRRCAATTASDIAGLPIDRIQQAIQPERRAARGARRTRQRFGQGGARPSRPPARRRWPRPRPARLAAMQTRLEAMISAVNIVQPPLDISTAC